MTVELSKNLVQKVFCEAICYAAVNSAFTVGSLFTIAMVTAQYAACDSLAQQGCDPTRPYQTCTDTQIEQAGVVADHAYSVFLMHCAIAGAVFGLIQGVISSVYTAKKQSAAIPDSRNDAVWVALRMFHFITFTLMAATIGNLIGVYLIGNSVGAAARDQYLKDHDCSPDVYNPQIACPGTLDTATQIGQHAMRTTVAATTAVVTAVGVIASVRGFFGRELYSICMNSIRGHQNTEQLGFITNEVRPGQSPA